MSELNPSLGMRGSVLGMLAVFGEETSLVESKALWTCSLLLIFVGCWRTVSVRVGSVFVGSSFRTCK